MENDAKLIVCIDVDGTIHSYEEGWKDGELYGTVLPGFFDWVRQTQKDFRLVIFSTRCADPTQLQKLEDWLREKYAEWAVVEGHIDEPPPTLEYTAVKIPAHVYLDDRALRFNGNWGDPAFSVEALRRLSPWNVAPASQSG